LGLSNGEYAIANSYSSIDSVEITIFNSSNEKKHSTKFFADNGSIDVKIRLAEISNYKICIAYENYDQNGVGTFLRIIDLNNYNITNSIQANINYWDYQVEPDVIKLDNNKFAVSWMRTLSDSTLAYCRIFNNTGQPVTDEIKSDTEMNSLNHVRLLLNSDNSSFYMLWEGDVAWKEEIYAKKIYFDGSSDETIYTFFKGPVGDNWIDDIEVQKLNSSDYFIVYDGNDTDWSGIFGALVLENLTDIMNNNGLPSSFTLSQNYPNPFNPSTKIKYDVPQNSFVNITIYNLLGETVAELVNKDLNAGNYEATWNAENLPSSVYLISIRAESLEGNKSFSDVQKAVLLK